MTDATERARSQVSWRHLSLVLLVVAIALLVRVPQLNLSASGDEPFSIITADRSWPDMNRELIADFVHPPLHYYLLHLWFRVVGFGVQQARWVSVFFGVSAVVALYLLGSYLFGRTTGLISALLLGISQMAVLYSRESRPYAMALFLTVLASYFFVVSTRERRQPYWWAFIASTILLGYTLYYSAFLLVAVLGFHFLYRPETSGRVPRSWWILGSIAVVVACLPWAASGVVQQALHASKVSFGNVPAYQTHWYTPVTLINRFNNGGLSESGLNASGPPWSYAVGGILFTIPALLSLRVLRPDRRAAISEAEGVVFALWLFVLPILTISALGLLHIQFQPRYLLFCAPPYYLLVARGISLLPSLGTRALLLVPLVAYSAYGIEHIYAYPFNEDTSGALAFVSDAYEAGDCAILLPENKLALQWKNDHPKPPPFRVLDRTPERSAESISIDSTGCRRTWAIVIVAFSMHARDVLAERMSEQHVLVAERSFRKVEVLLYEPRKKAE